MKEIKAMLGPFRSLVAMGLVWLASVPAAAESIYSVVYRADEPSPQLYRVAVDTLEGTFIGPLGVPADALAYDPVSDELYAVDDDLGLLMVDRTTGQATPVGSTTLAPRRVDDATVDAAGRLWVLAATTRFDTPIAYELIELDVTTGAIVGSIEVASDRLWAGLANVGVKPVLTEQGSTLVEIDATTGESSFVQSLSAQPYLLATRADGSGLFALEGGAGPGGIASPLLYQIDPIAGTEVLLGVLPLAVGPGSVNDELVGMAVLPRPAVDPPGCQPAPQTLCLGDRRFQVTARWETTDDSGDGRANPLTDDTGSFWFFRPGNLELMVKVLDNCNGPTGRFWVFAAGLTNLYVEIEVTDTYTDLVRTYRSSLDLPFEPIFDTAAFDTCGSLPNRRHRAAVGVATRNTPP